MIVIVLAALLAGPEAAPRAEILGIWKGTSTCVDKVRFPACNDEVVIYEVTEKKAEAESVHLKADKVVGGERGTMGEMDFTFDRAKGAWLCDFRTPRYHGLWTFVVKGDAIEGTLTDLPDGQLVRRVAVRREK